jgi:poly(3-hydroxybutyrate) depolymerase
LVARGYGSRGVFVAGYSNGGMIALQTVCDHPTLFEGVAMISSAVPAAVGENCGASFPSRFVLVNGTEDPIMPIKGGVGANAALGSLWSPARLGDALLHRRQCTRLASISIHEKSLGGQSVELFRAVNCKLPGIIALYLVSGGKHEGYGDENWKERSSGPADVFLAPEMIIKAFSGAKPATRKTKTSLKVPPSAPVSLE